MIVNEIAKFEKPPMRRAELLGVPERVQHAPVLVVVRLRFHLTSLRGVVSAATSGDSLIPGGRRTRSHR